MNKRIKELAEQAGCVLHGLVWVANDEDFERFAELVRQDEREQAEKQEPKAWIYEGNLHIFDPTDWAIEPESVQPLYTAPPKREWVGLTDKEISLVLDKNTWASGYASWGQFAKDIEAKLKERNT
jgi:hypothetical protein